MSETLLSGAGVLFCTGGGAEAQVTLIELNRVTEEIRARKKNKAQPNKTKQKTPKQHPNTQTAQVGLVSHQGCQSRSDCLESEVKRGIEFILLSALSS